MPQRHQETPPGEQRTTVRFDNKAVVVIVPNCGKWGGLKYSPCRRDGGLDRLVWMLDSLDARKSRSESKLGLSRICFAAKLAKGDERAPSTSIRTSVSPRIRSWN